MAARPETELDTPFVEQQTGAYLPHTDHVHEALPYDASESEEHIFIDSPSSEDISPMPMFGPRSLQDTAAGNHEGNKEPALRTRGERGAGTIGFIGKCVAAAMVVAVGVGVYSLFKNKKAGFSEKDQARTEREEVTLYYSDLTTCIGDLAVLNNLQLDRTAGIDIDTPGVDIVPDIQATSTYKVTAPGAMEFCVPGLAAVSSTRKNVNEAPLATDEVTVLVDKSKLYVNRPRVDSSATKQKYVVRDGMVVKRDGIKLVDPQPIFAKDGKYEIPAYKEDGGTAFFNDVLETITFGGYDASKGIGTELNTLSQLATGYPECIRRAWQVVSPTGMATEAFENALVMQGYSRDKIDVEFLGEWPKPKAIKDDQGKTYKQRQVEVGKTLPDDTDVSVGVKCYVDDLKDTRKKPATPARNASKGKQSDARALIQAQLPRRMN